MGKMISPLVENPPASVNALSEREATRHRHGIVFILAAALVIRLSVFVIGLDKGLFYPDEFEYVELAKNLAEGHGFSYKGQLTSFRPPGYAFLISAMFRLFDTTSPIPVRALQILFSVITVYVVYRLGRDGWGERLGLWAAGIFAFYPSLIGFNNMLLTEPSFMLCVSLACWTMMRYLQAPHVGWIVGMGVSLGLGALIRDTLFYAAPITTAFLLIHAFKNRRYPLRHVAAFVGGFAIVILPWIVRNTQLQGQFTLISTVGGINLYMCNNEETPMIHTGYVFFEWAVFQKEGYYYDHLFPELAGTSEAVKQSVAMRKSLEYMWNNPGTTALRTLSRLVDFWGQERLVINQVMASYYGNVSGITIFAMILAVFASYSAVAVSAGFGYFFTRLRAFDIWGLLFIAYYTGMHALVQGHPRYHIPLLPFLAVMAARAFLIRNEIYANRRSWRFVGAMSVMVIFVIMWIIGIFYFDADKVEMIMQWIK
jgi:4-amino-4-deoxy-L-arabinose transferase-like glycosyltransferase